MYKLSAAIFVLFLLFAGAGMTRAQDTASPEKRALIKELFEAVGGKDTADKIVNAMITAEQKEVPHMIDAMIDSDKMMPAAAKRIAKEMATDMVGRILVKTREFFATQVDLGEVTEQMMVSIYDKNFTESELRELIAFYRTPVAQKGIRLAPQIMSEAISVFSEKLGPKFYDFLTKAVEDEVAQIKTQLPASKKKPSRRS